MIELGSGWGALALHMARERGVRVRAWNVSREQVAYAREQAEKQQLEDRVEFVLDDYRNATAATTRSSRSACSSTSDRVTTGSSER